MKHRNSMQPYKFKT